ncbi:MAG: CAAX prenyl protease-related protein [Verrucomicrobia bacterium]|nr:CAAX prenyl protease-related protein [Verrucomicrobiota bacterium]
MSSDRPTEPKCESRPPIALLRAKLGASPILVRVAPLAVFILLTVLQGRLGEESRYWIYLAKTLVGAWFIWLIRPLVAELRWAVSWEAIAVGVAVFAAWVGLNDFYPKLGGAGTPWNPFAHFGAGSALGWLFVVVRIVGSTVVVPPLEEVFYRSFLYRYLAKPDFLSVPLRSFALVPFCVSAGIFGLAHYEWVAGILCGAAYQALVLRKGRLGDALTAHALTNLLLGLWVVGRGQWQFW